MIKVEFTTQARLKMFYMLASMQGTAEEQAIFEDIENALALTDEEKTAIGLEESRDAAGDLLGAAWRPDVEASATKMEVELETDHGKRLLNLLKTWPRFTRADRAWSKEAIRVLKGEL